jgi:hypothetical protein
MSDDLDKLVGSSESKARAEKAKKSEKYRISNTDYLMEKLY